MEIKPTPSPEQSTKEIHAIEDTLTNKINFDEFNGEPIFKPISSPLSQ